MSNNVTNTHSGPTPKQIAYAESLARKAGYNYFDQAVKAWCGKNPVNGLNRAEISALIDWLRK